MAQKFKRLKTVEHRHTQNAATATETTRVNGVKLTISALPLELFTRILHDACVMIRLEDRTYGGARKKKLFHDVYRRLAPVNREWRDTLLSRRFFFRVRQTVHHLVPETQYLKYAKPVPVRGITVPAGFHVTSSAFNDRQLFLLFLSLRIENFVLATTERIVACDVTKSIRVTSQRRFCKLECSNERVLQIPGVDRPRKLCTSTAAESLFILSEFNQTAAVITSVSFDGAVCYWSQRYNINVDAVFSEVKIMSLHALQNEISINTRGELLRIDSRTGVVTERILNFCDYFYNPHFGALTDGDQFWRKLEQRHIRYWKLFKPVRMEKLSHSKSGGGCIVTFVRKGSNFSRIEDIPCNEPHDFVIVAHYMLGDHSLNPLLDASLLLRVLAYRMKKLRKEE